MDSANPLDSAQTRRRILDAATEEFAATGFAGARVDRIAEQAQANKQLIYRYFGSKQKLYEAVFSDLVTRIRGERSDDAHSAGRSIFETMLGAEGESEYLTSHMVRTLTWEGLAAHVSSETVMGERRENYAQAVAWIRGEQDAGRVRSDVSAEHIVALAVAAGGLPYAMPNVFQFIFGREPSADDRRDWRSFVMTLVAP